MKRMTIGMLLGWVCWIGLGPWGMMAAQEEKAIEKELALVPRKVQDTGALIHLIPPEEAQEAGNAVPVLLRLVYEQNAFMREVYPKFNEYVEMEMGDPRLKEVSFDRFASQIIRAGSMRSAEWEYPIKEARPETISLPDQNTPRHLVGMGMTIWIKQKLAEGDIDAALAGIQGQLGCSRHHATAPIMVCSIVGMSIANYALDNIELLIQQEKSPNLYWALAALPPTLQDMGPAIRWELWSSIARLDEPLPEIGDAAWRRLARIFAERLSVHWSPEPYTEEEARMLKTKLERLAYESLSVGSEFSKEEVEKMSGEERMMRWLHRQFCQMRVQIESVVYASPIEMLDMKETLEERRAAFLSATGAKSSPFPDDFPQLMLICRQFERRVKFLQTLEALRDYADRHAGQLPTTLGELALRAPRDPFTGEPFVYTKSGKTARLSQEWIAGLETPIRDYEIRVKAEGE